MIDGEETAWECECGNVQYAELAPEECEKCFGISTFTQLPEELVEEREKEMMEMDMDIEMPKAKSGKSIKSGIKNKPGKLKKRKRK